MSDQKPKSDRVQDLTWSLIDQRASDAECRELGKLLKEDAEARAIYVQCMQLHADLTAFFNKEQTGFSPQPTENGPALVPPVGNWGPAQPQQPQ